MGTKALVYVLLICTLVLQGCEYRYRYPCQDPANWKKPECNNEVCRVEGDCTDILLGSSYTPRSRNDPNRP